MSVSRKIRSLVVGSMAAVAGVAAIAAASTTASASTLQNPIQLSIGSTDVLETGVGLNRPVKFGFNNNSADEKWRVEYTGAKVNGKAEFKLRNKDNGQCLGVSAATASVEIQTRSCGSNTNWYLGGNNSSGPKPLFLSGTNLVMTRFNSVVLQQNSGSSLQQVKVKILYGQTA